MLGLMIQLFVYFANKNDDVCLMIKYLILHIPYLSKVESNFLSFRTLIDTKQSIWRHFPDGSSIPNTADGGWVGNLSS